MSPGRRVGPYRLIELLGRGGMGEVWRADDVTGAAGGAPRQVALKLLDPALTRDPDARARFAREVAAAGLVRGASVAALLDADVDADQPWLASAYVAGPSLADHVARHGPLADAPLRALGVALADALVSIHGAGVVHRDLTPRNVVLGPDGPRVVDFGIAWYTGSAAITRTGSWVGTPAWMPPERLTSDRVTAASDVWSWGAIMAFAARGSPPVAADASPEVSAQRLAAGVVELDGVPGWLAPSVRAAMGPDPSLRPLPEDLLATMSGTLVPEGGSDALPPTAPHGGPTTSRTGVASAGPASNAAAPIDPAAALDQAQPSVDPRPTVSAGDGPPVVRPAPPAAAPDQSPPVVDPPLPPAVPHGGPSVVEPPLAPTVPYPGQPAGAGGRHGGAALAGRRRLGGRGLARWGSAAVVIAGAVAIGLVGNLLVIAIALSLLVMTAVALRLGRERLPEGTRPIPPTWSVGLAGPVVLGTALVRELGPLWGLAVLVAVVVVFVLLGGDIG